RACFALTDRAAPPLGSSRPWECPLLWGAFRWWGQSTRRAASCTPERTLDRTEDVLPFPPDNDVSSAGHPVVPLLQTFNHVDEDGRHDLDLEALRLGTFGALRVPQPIEVAGPLLGQFLGDRCPVILDRLMDLLLPLRPLLRLLLRQLLCHRFH